ncbi:MAG: hypothetical protein GC206_06535 [Alphaproteobacteria bacterium]|nr:hypothetical protein [Alphaproteobacteria bacterium]
MEPTSDRRARLPAALALIAAAACAAAAPLQAQTYSGESPGIIFFEGVNYSGQQRDFPDIVTDLARFRFNDRARSVAIDERAWELCEHADFEGRCVIIDRDAPNLAAIGLAGRVSSARPVMRPAPPAPRLALYPTTGMAGPPLELTSETPDLRPLGFNDMARSLRTDEPWEVCANAGFGGRCRTVQGEVSDLRAIGLAGAISSARPLAGGPAGESASLRGRTAMFFAETQQPACAAGSANQDCFQRTADEFCRRQGYRESGYFAIDRRRAPARLGDVLCLR